MDALRFGLTAAVCSVGKRCKDPMAASCTFVKTRPGAPALTSGKPPGAVLPMMPLSFTPIEQEDTAA